MSPRLPEDHATRLRRVANMAAWLAEVETATVAEAASRFGVTDDVVVGDIGLLMEAVYGREEESLISVALEDDGTVMSWERRVFSRPLRLHAADALGLLAAGEAALAGVQQEGEHLRAALRKLRAAVDNAGTVAIDVLAPPVLADLRRAAAERLVVELRYYSQHRDAVTDRRVRPLAVYQVAGQWYLLAVDELSGDDRRRFRLANVLDLEVTDERFDPVEAEVPTTEFERVPASRDLVLRLPAAGRWVAELYRWTVVRVDGDDGLEVVVPVTGEAWLAQLLLRLGPEARVVEPAELAGAGRALAARLLELYRE